MNMLGARIRRVREYLKIKPKEVAKAIEVSYGNYLKIENGETQSPGYLVLKKFIEFTNCNPGYLFGTSEILLENTYANAVSTYMSSLPDTRQKEVLILIRQIKNSYEEIKIEKDLKTIMT